MIATTDTTYTHGKVTKRCSAESSSYDHGDLNMAVTENVIHDYGQHEPQDVKEKPPRIRRPKVSIRKRFPQLAVRPQRCGHRQLARKKKRW